MEPLTVYEIERTPLAPVRVNACVCTVLLRAGVLDRSIDRLNDGAAGCPLRVLDRLGESV